MNNLYTPPLLIIMGTTSEVAKLIFNVYAIFYYIQFNITYSNYAFLKIIVPNEGNITLATMPDHKSWVMAQLSHSCSPSDNTIGSTLITAAIRELNLISSCV
jgi:hypothetical protein